MMPVIRVDDDVWAKLKSLAEPLEDTPNTVLRRVLRLADGGSQGGTHESIEIQPESWHTPVTYALVPIPKGNRPFFPGYKVRFALETDIEVLQVQVTGGSKGDQIGAPDAGDYFVGGLRDFYKRHPNLKRGDKFRIEALDPGKRYRLTVIKA